MASDSQQNMSDNQRIAFLSGNTLPLLTFILVKRNYHYVEKKLTILFLTEWWVHISLLDDNDEAFEFAFEAFYLLEMTTDGILHLNSFYRSDFYLTDTHIVLTKDKITLKFKTNRDAETHLKHMKAAYLCKCEKNSSKVFSIYIATEHK